MYEKVAVFNMQLGSISSCKNVPGAIREQKKTRPAR